MKKIITLLFLMFCTVNLVAKEKVLTLDQAVSQVKKQNSGQILSAKTYSNTHEIKILSANGKIKRIKIPVMSSKRKNVRHNHNIYQRDRGHSSSNHSNHRSSGHSNSNHSNSSHRSSSNKSSGSEKSKNK